MRTSLRQNSSAWWVQRWFLMHHVHANLLFVQLVQLETTQQNTLLLLKVTATTTTQSVTKNMFSLLFDPSAHTRTTDWMRCTHQARQTERGKNVDVKLSYQALGNSNQAQRSIQIIRKATHLYMCVCVGGGGGGLKFDRKTHEDDEKKRCAPKAALQLYH